MGKRFTERVAEGIAKAHAAGRHKRYRPLNCWQCVLTGEAVSFTSTPLYPDRHEIWCRRCQAYHWSPGRCFMSDATFRRVVGIPISNGKRLRLADLPPGPSMVSLADVAAGKPASTTTPEERERILQELRERAPDAPPAPPAPDV